MYYDINKKDVVRLSTDAALNSVFGVCATSSHTCSVLLHAHAKKNDCNMRPIRTNHITKPFIIYETPNLVTQLRMPIQMICDEVRNVFV